MDMDTGEIRERIQLMKIEPTAGSISDLADFCYALASELGALEAKVARMDKALKNLCDKNT